MLAQDPATSAPHVIRLAATISIRDAAALKEALRPLLARSAPVAFEVTDVARVDTAILQLLFAFARDRDALGLPVLWQGDSPAWCIAIGFLNPIAVSPRTSLSSSS